MTTHTSPSITQLLRRCRAGDREAAEELLPLVYDHLRQLAETYLSRERSNHTLQPEALVNEVYMRLLGGEPAQQPEWKSSAHFFVIAARQMRNVLVDYERARQSAKRGGLRQQIELEDVTLVVPPLNINLLALEEALQRLERVHPRPATIVELRYFGGLTEVEAAKALDISVSTLRRDWEFARMWLYDKLHS